MCGSLSRHFSIAVLIYIATYLGHIAMFVPAPFAPAPLDSLFSTTDIPPEVRQLSTDATQVPHASPQLATRELVIFDDRVENWLQLATDIERQRAGGRAIDYVVLERDRDGVQQISEILRARRDLSAVHLVSHGAAGALQLGSTRLQLSNVAEYTSQLLGWQDAFAADGDLLIYGCNLAGSEDGQLLLESLAILTATDIAASEDLTGNAKLNGDWNLERQLGQVEQPLAFSHEVRRDWQGALDINIDQAWLNARGPGPYYLDQANTRYILQTDVSTPGTAFAIIANDVTFDLNGHTITYNNSAPIVVPNGSFEQGTDTAATGWDFSNAPNAQRYAGDFFANDVYDGTQSLKIGPGFSGTQFITGATITLKANSTYSLTAMFKNGQFASGVSSFVRLVGQNVSKLHEVIWDRGNNRGIQWKETTFTTGAADESYRIVAGANNPDGLANFFSIIDDIKIQRTKTYGVITGAGQSDAALFPELATFGAASNSRITNGLIIQGQDKGSWSPGLYNNGPDTEFDHLTVYVAGANSSAMIGRYASGARVHHNQITSDVVTIDNRDGFDGAVIYRINGEIYNNTIVGGPHCGILSMGVQNSIHDNVISTRSRYTNGFAIMLWNDQGSEVYSNTIRSATEDFSGRGIHVNRKDLGDAVPPTVVRDNEIYVRELSRNQEYGGAVLGGAYGIQLEKAYDVQVLNNQVFAVAEVTGGYALRLNNYADLADVGVVITGNTFSGTRTNSSVYAGSLMLTKLGTVNQIDFHDNTLVSNYGWIGDTSYIDGFDLNNSRLEILGDGADFVPVQAHNWGTGDTTLLRAIRGLRWIDNQPASSLAQLTLAQASLGNFTNGGFDSNSWFVNAYSTIIHVQNGGAAVANATVEIRNTQGDVVFQGTTDASGTTRSIVAQYRVQGDQNVDFNDFVVKVVHAGVTHESTINISGPETHLIDLQSGGTTSNQAPILDNAGMMAFNPLWENQIANSGQSAASIIASAGGDRITDVDTGAMEGIAITAANSGNGTWQYSTDAGSSWTNLGTVSNALALLLRDTDWVRFVPNAQNGTSASLTFRAWDQSSGTAGSKVDTSGNGGTTAFSTATETATITVNSVNDAPVLDNSGVMTLSSITEDQTNHAGQTIASIIASAGGDRISDVDSGAVEGIAITGVQNGNGWWQFSTNGGSSWQNVGAVSGTSALLLRDSDLVRFRPNAQNGTSASLTLKAWDQSSGAAGTKVDTSTSGGNTAFSSASETASMTVTSVNDAPVLDSAGTMQLDSIADDATDNPGNTVAQIIASAGGDRITDVDANPTEGIAVYYTEGSNGAWQYSTNGGSTWQSVGTVSDAASLLLRSSDLLRFVPGGANSAAPFVRFRAWDRTSGSQGTKVNTTANGGTTAFSSALEVASISVTTSGGSPYVVQQQGSTLYAYGNQWNNYFSWSAYVPSEFFIDGYRHVVPTGVDSIVFEGGDGTDTFQVNGTPGSDSLIAHPESADFSSLGWLIRSQTSENLIALGEGGADTATLHDSSGDDVFSASHDWADLTGAGFGYRVEHFATLTLQSSGQAGDEAYLYDSPENEQFVATPTYAQMTFSGGAVRAEGFRTTRAYSFAGNDTAQLYDSTGDDRLLGTLAAVRLIGDLFFNNVVGFGSVQAFATAAPNQDQVNLTATEATRVVVGADGVELSDRTRTVIANGFRRQDIQGSTAPDAEVELHGAAGNDTYRGRGSYSVLQGGGTTARVNNFNRVIAFAGPGGNNDVAYLFDTAGDDLLQGTGNVVSLSSGSYHNTASGFDRTIAYGTVDQAGDPLGDDVARLNDTVGVDQYWGYYDRAIMKGPGYETRAFGFARTLATSSAGGGDSANLFDSAGDDSLVGDMANLRLFGNGFSNSAHGFGTVYATASGNNVNDRLDLSDSAGNDEVLIESGLAQLAGSGIWVRAIGFGTQIVRSSFGGIDTVRMTISGKDNIVQSYDDRTIWSRAGLYARAESFANVYVTASPGSSHNQATLYNASAAETLRFDGNYASYESSTRFRRVEGFDQITAYYNSANDLVYTGTPSYTLSLQQV